MPIRNPVYPLKNIFTNLLVDTGKVSFLIPSYQRGYKWTSFGDESQIEVIMRDLCSAFERDNNRPYYLQFITIKENGEQLEVIDGQQRLTTLTILFSVLYNFQKEPLSENFIVGKLEYQIRENFVKQYIYNNIELLLQSGSWTNFIEGNDEHNNQDVFFLYHATQAIANFIENKIDIAKRHEFYEYLCEKVFLIVNLLDPEINSEKIFFNVNKGVKLKDEDLVKGLLITKIPLDDQSRQFHISENEINEIRSNIGRQWDELVLWATREDINRFYINSIDESPLRWLIRLTYPDVKISKNPYPMFSHLDDLYRTKKATASELFGRLRNTMLSLNDLYFETELKNLLGYILHVKESAGIEKIWRELSPHKTKSEILQKLKQLCLALIPVDENGLLKDLNYEEHKTHLFRLFLMLDISKFLPIAGRKVALYNFDYISSQEWSIEHIFPQNPKDFKSLESLTKEDLAIVKELIPKNMDRVGAVDSIEEDKKDIILKLFIKIEEASNVCLISSDEREVLVAWLEKSGGNLHRLGNLALLERGINSGLSNHYFDRKRKMIVQKVSEGKFIPYHTYDVFSKLIIHSDTGLNIWSKRDIELHETYINVQVESIVEYLSPKVSQI